MKKILLIILTLLIFSCSEKTSYVKLMLPKTATEVKEHYQDRGFSGDYTRLIKAKVTKEEYEDYAIRLNLTDKYSDYLKTNTHQSFMRENSNTPEWWDEPKDLNDFYYVRDINKEYERRLKWKDGWLYPATEAW